ncbi:MAG TPA: hemolysin III family protein [Oscillatoriaceae cyanobacterium]
MSTFNAQGRFAIQATSRFRDPVNGFLHLFALIAAIAAIAWLLFECRAEVVRFASVLVYGLGMIGCFAASTCHHLIRGSRRLELRLLRLDHAAIYPFIAGTYTPICLCLLPATGGLTLLAAVWALALVGVVYKLGFARDQSDVNDPPPLLDTLLYIAMGWLVLFQASPLLAQALPGSLAFALVGGLAYSLGGVILSQRWFDLWPGRFGHHEIWHLCVILGSAGLFAFIAANLT